MKNLVILIAVALVGLTGCATTGMDGINTGVPANLSVNYQEVGGHHATGISYQTGAYANAPVLIAPAPVLMPPPVIYPRPIFCPPVPYYGVTQHQIDQARRQQQWAIDQARRQQQWAIDQARQRQRCY